MASKLNVYGLSLARLTDLLVTSLNLPKYRGKQLYDGLFKQKQLLDSVKTLSAAQKEALRAAFEFTPGSITQQHRSTDGTVKFLIQPPETGDAVKAVEAVYIPEFGAPGRSRARGGSKSAVIMPRRAGGQRGGGSGAVVAPELIEVVDCDDEEDEDEDAFSEDSDDDAEGASTARRVGAPELSGKGRARGTLCVSSQVGCGLACTFCHTGTQRFNGNLTPADIVGQVVVAMRSDAFQRPSTAAPAGSPSSSPTSSGSGGLPVLPPINHIVFMGQGEPLLNWRNVSAAINILTCPDGLGLAPRRITVSTSGVAPVIPRIATETPGVQLAVSLHAPNDELRSRIMGINKQYPLAALLPACKEFLQLRAAGGKGGATASSAPAGRPKPSARGASSSSSSMAQYTPAARRNRVTFEYVMLAGVNDSLDHARQLRALLFKYFDRAQAHVNLIPFNPWPGSPYEASPWSAITDFQRVVMDDKGLRTTIRRSRGDDVLGACGQLKSSAESKVVRRAAAGGAGSCSTGTGSGDSGSAAPASC